MKQSIRKLLFTGLAAAFALTGLFAPQAKALENTATQTITINVTCPAGTYYSEDEGCKDIPDCPTGAVFVIGEGCVDDCPYAHNNNSPTTDISSIWGSANFAGKITGSNASGGGSEDCSSSIAIGVFCITFNGVLSLTGSAQTFIDYYLGGIVPDVRARTFNDTQVTDLSSLHANWK